MGRIGLFGGSFDPIHNGHLHLAEQARTAFALDQVILIPARLSPFKQELGAITPPADRLAMCQLAAQELPDCTVSDFELEGGRVSYTCYTVQHFRELYPEDELILLMGSDMFLSFHRWFRWQEILELAALGVVSREEGDGAALEQQRRFLLQYGEIYLCTAPPYTISSTKIRENIRNQKNFSCYLPKKVVQYIISHDLYQVQN